MPLVGGDLCPIAIDIIEKFEQPEEELEEEYDSPLHYVDHKEIFPDEEKFEDRWDEGEEEREANEIIESDDEIIEEDEDHPIIEKGEHHKEGIEEDEEHFIPEKGEHDYNDEEHVDAEHLIPQKGEHHESDIHQLDKNEWMADYHGHEDVQEEVV